MSQRGNFGRLIIGLVVGVVLTTGIGYFAPSLWLEERNEADAQALIHFFEEQMPRRDERFIFPEYDDYLQKKIQAIYSPIIGAQHIRSVVHTHLNMTEKTIETEQLLPETALISSQTVSKQENGDVVKETRYVYSTQKTQTHYFSYDVERLDVVLFLVPPTDDRMSRFFKKKQAELLQSVYALTGYSRERGDSVRVITFPKGMSFAKDGLSLRQIHQVIAISLISFGCLFVLMGIVLPWAINRRKKLFSFQFKDYGQSNNDNIYQSQIVGPLEETLVSQARQLCLKMPDVAVNVIRTKLYAVSGTQESANQVFSPAQQAAMVLMCLGDKTVKHLFKQMTDAEIKTLSRLMALIGRVKTVDMHPILFRFCQEMQLPQDILEPVAQTEAIIKTALPAEKVAAFLKELPDSYSGKTVWEKLNKVPNAALKIFFQKEYPQTAAEVLYHLSTEKASRMLMLLPITYATEVIVRLSSIHYMNTDKGRSGEKSSEENGLTGDSRTAGEQKAAAVLSLSEPLLRQKLLDEIACVAPQVADNLLKQIITFDDFAFWKEKDLTLILKHVDPETLLLALSHASDATKEAFSRVMSPQKWAQFLKKMNETDQVKVQDVELSQQAIIQIAQQLVDSKKCKGKRV